MLASEHTKQHTVGPADGGQQKQCFFRDTAFRTLCGAFIITTDGKGNQIDCQKVNDKIIHVQIIARKGRFGK